MSGEGNELGQALKLKISSATSFVFDSGHMAYCVGACFPFSQMDTRVLSSHVGMLKEHEIVDQDSYLMR